MRFQVHPKDFLKNGGILALLLSLFFMTDADCEEPPQQICEKIFSFHSNPTFQIELSPTENISTTGTSISMQSKLLRGKNDYLNKVIEEIEKEGGEIRIVRFDSLSSDPKIREKIAAYNKSGTFTLSDRDTPLIYIGYNADQSVLAHEYSHFKDVLDRVNKYSKKEASRGSAWFREINNYNGKSLKLSGEKRAIIAELKHAEKVDIFDPNFISRINYPEVRAYLSQEYGPAILDKVAWRSLVIRRARFRKANTLG